MATVLAGPVEAGTHRADVDVSRLAPGVYVVRASVNHGGAAVVETARLTVAR